MQCFLVDCSYPSYNRAHGETECLGHARARSCRRVVDVCESVTIVAVHSLVHVDAHLPWPDVDPSIDRCCQSATVGCPLSFSELVNADTSRTYTSTNDRAGAHASHLAQHARNAIISFPLFTAAGVLAHHIPPPHTKRHRLHLHNPLRRCTMQ